MAGSEGRQTTSRLEQYARRTTALWTIMAERGIDAQPSWTAADGHGKEQLGAVGVFTSYPVCCLAFIHMALD